MLVEHTNLVQFDRAKLKTVKTLFPLHREGLTSYLSPLFGQYAVKNNEFISEFVKVFNLATNGLFKDLLNLESAESGGSLYGEVLFIPLLVNIYKGGKFSILVGAPTLGFLYSTCFKKRRRLYRRIWGLEEEFVGLRNYKKLLQISSFKILNCDMNLIYDQQVPLIQQYKLTRNALQQRH